MTTDYTQLEVSEGIDLGLMEQFLRVAKERGYVFVTTDEMGGRERFIVMRHDIDLDPLLALEVARLQARFKVRATYYVMLRNPLYNLLSRRYQDCLRELAALGQTIGLHFDASFYPGLEGEGLKAAISRELNVLREVVGVKDVSRCVSFHKPSPYILQNELVGDDFYSAYNQSYFRDLRYISDSCGRWREETILEVIESGRFPKIQFTSHPIWWVMSGKTIGDRLRAYLDHREVIAEEDVAETINDPTRGIVLHRPPPAANPTR